MKSFSSPVFGVKLGVNWQVKSFSSPVFGVELIVK